MTITQFLNYLGLAAILYCAAVIGWAAVGTHSDRKDR